MIDSFLEGRVQRRLDAGRQPGLLLAACIERRPAARARVARLLVVDQALRAAAGRERLIVGERRGARHAVDERPAVLARIGWGAAGLAAAAAVTVAATVGLWPEPTRDVPPQLANVSPQPTVDVTPLSDEDAGEVEVASADVRDYANPSFAVAEVGAELEAPLRREWDLLVADMRRAVEMSPLPMHLLDTQSTEDEAQTGEAV